METFAERLKLAIQRRGISQSEAARLCGIAQQSLNYIITNNLRSSKLATKIASALRINPEWLVLGYGKFEETKIYELPIIHSAYMLKKFLHNKLDENAIQYVFIDIFLGSQAFGYLVESKKIAICSTEILKTTKVEYLNFIDTKVTFGKKNGELSFPIFEWRIRNVDF